jgi:hypothetical protein
MGGAFISRKARSFEVALEIARVEVTQGLEVNLYPESLIINRQNGKYDNETKTFEPDVWSINLRLRK